MKKNQDPQAAMKQHMGLKASTRLTNVIVYILLVFVGSTISLALVWNLADIMNALMAIPNLVSLLLLSGMIARETQHYLWNNHLDEKANDDESAPS